jgi:hypothetical protein
MMRELWNKSQNGSKGLKVHKKNGKTPVLNQLSQKPGLTISKITKTTVHKMTLEAILLYCHCVIFSKPVNAFGP